MNNLQKEQVSEMEKLRGVGAMLSVTTLMIIVILTFLYGIHWWSYIGGLSALGIAGFVRILK